MSSVCGANPTYRGECDSYIAVIPRSAATITAVKSGLWNDPMTWSNGIPGAKDIVWIPYGIPVMLRGSGVFKGLLVEDLLTFDPTVNTSLTGDTIIVGTDTDVPNNPRGQLDIGTAAAPIQAGVTATITFTDGGPLSTTFPLDTKQLSRGLIYNGVVNVYGNPVTPFVVASGGLSVGSSSITLSSAPSGWSVGDLLLIPGTSPTVNQDEQPVIASISGTTLILSAPLLYSHVSPAGQPVQVANQQRNIVLQSANATDPTRHGHVMVMHQNSVHIEYASFLNLGRTDKSKPINTTTNVRGRYGLHLHRCYWPGITDNDPPISVIGCFESGSPGWGYVNHSSNVAFTSDVAFNDFGSGFAAEAGNEIGTLDGCLSVRSPGDGTGIATRIGNNDFGQGGDGFWFQGPQMAVRNCIGTGAGFAEFAWYNHGLNEPGLGQIQAWPSTIVNPAVRIDGHIFVDPAQLVLGPQANNEAYGCNEAAAVWNSNPLPSTVAPFERRSIVNGLTAWNTKISNAGQGTFCVDFEYCSNVDLDNSWLYGNPANPAGYGLFLNADYNQGGSARNCRIEGFNVGAEMPKAGTCVVDGGTFNNNQDILILSRATIGKLTILNQPTFAGQAYTLGPIAVGPDDSYNDLFLCRETVLIQQSDGTFKQLYWKEQAPDYVMFPASGPQNYYVTQYLTNLSKPQPPAALVGLTVAQMYAKYGLCFAGFPAPADAVPDPSTNGLIGSVMANPPPLIYLPNQPGKPGTVFWPASSPYTLEYQYQTTPRGTLLFAQTFTVVETTPITLAPGWNLLTRTVANTLYTFLVFGT